MSDYFYLELLEDAHKALHALLDETDHGKGLSVRRAYHDLEEAIRWHRDEPPPVDLAEPVEPTKPEERHWKRVPMLERERLILTILTEQRLTIRELVDQVCVERPELTSVWPTGMASIVKRLYDARELDRVGEHFGRGSRRRYRYFRRVELDGAIAELDRAYHSDEEPC